MRDIMRTISVTGCSGQCINALGEFEPFSDVLEGIVGDPRQATIRLRKIHNDQTITINHTEPHVGQYVLSAEDFVKYAKEIN